MAISLSMVYICECVLLYKACYLILSQTNPLFRSLIMLGVHVFIQDSYTEKEKNSIRYNIICPHAIRLCVLFGNSVGILSDLSRNQFY